VALITFVLCKEGEREENSPVYFVVISSHSSLQEEGVEEQ